MLLKSVSCNSDCKYRLNVNADMAYRQIKLTNATQEFIDGALMWLGRESTGVYSTHSSFPHYDTGLFARCGPGIEIKSIEWILQTQQCSNNYMKHISQEDLNYKFV